ncbi:metal-dependent hydrolase [Candidatus Woesearchaeota archaeon]|nr:metal-dependent hydrolase [Candidatus Woesearchaeota archaeon]
MANPVTHILVPMLIVEAYRRYFAKKRFSKWYVFIAGLLGGAPDFDLFISLFANGWTDTTMHRTFTHTLLIPIALLLSAGAIILLRRKKLLRSKGWNTARMLLIMAAIGFASHTFLDGIEGFTQWFFPLSISIHLPNLLGHRFVLEIVDGALLFIWILFDEELLNAVTARLSGTGRLFGSQKFAIDKRSKPSKRANR